MILSRIDQWNLGRSRNGLRSKTPQAFVAGGGRGPLLLKWVTSRQQDGRFLSHPPGASAGGRTKTPGTSFSSKRSEWRTGHPPPRQHFIRRFETPSANHERKTKTKSVSSRSIHGSWRTARFGWRAGLPSTPVKRERCILQLRPLNVKLTL